MNIFITYSDEKYAPARHFCAKMARWVAGFDKVIEYSPDDLDEDFKREQAKILAVKRGAGLWVWKSYVLLKTLNEVAKEGDVVFYADAGTFFIRNFRHILKTMDQDVWVSNIPLAEKQYTKREVFVKMCCEGAEYEDTPQCQGGFVGIRKSQEGIAFVEEWLRLVCDYSLLAADQTPDYPEIPEFVAHREDQSILSLLAKKYGYTAHLDPTQYGFFPEKLRNGKNTLIYNNHGYEYPACIILHRQPTIALKHILFQILHVVLPKRIVYMCLSKEYYDDGR